LRFIDIFFSFRTVFSKGDEIDILQK